MFAFRRSTNRFIVSAITIALLLSSMMVQPAYAAAPTVSVTRGGAPEASAAGVVTFTVTFSEAVKGVDSTDFQLAGGSIADAAITGVSGVDGDAVYTVSVSTGTVAGSVGVDVLADGTITNLADEPLAGAYTGGEIYQIRDPYVVSITKLDADPTSKASVRFRVIFSDAVEGVNKGTASDFTLTKTGTAGATITGLSGSGTNYTVTVKTALGNGTLGLNLVDDDTIHGPSGGRVLGGSGTGSVFTGEVYTVKKIPVPKKPSGTVYDTTPTFSWTPIPRATQYRFQVFKGTSTTPVYTLTAASTACTATACTKTPTTVLNPAAYKWWVQALIDGTWKPYSAKKSFTTIIGFNSQFNGSKTGWVARPGPAWTVNSAYYGTNGAVGKFASTNYNKTFSNFTYEVRMRRLPGLDGNGDFGGDRVGLIVRGAYDPAIGWKSGYVFEYSSVWQLYMVWRIVNGEWKAVIWYPYSSALVQSNWNTLKIVANGSSFKYFANGTLVWNGTLAGPTSGQVGVWTYAQGAWLGGASDNRLDVDWAKLTAMSPWPSAAQATVELSPLPGQLELTAPYLP